jgi:hypothetical protein
MNNEHITERIQQLMIERSALQSAHNSMAMQNQKDNQEFQQKAVQNQTRYAQITGAIIELQKLVPQPTQKETNNDHLPTTPSLNNRLADVCPVIEPQDR